MPAFTEIGFDLDNNKYLFGISTEVENKDGSESRRPGFVKMKIKGFYLRAWVLKTIFGIGIPNAFTLRKKNRNNFKVVFGLHGQITGCIGSHERIRR